MVYRSVIYTCVFDPMPDHTNHSYSLNIFTSLIFQTKPWWHRDCNKSAISIDQCRYDKTQRFRSEQTTHYEGMRWQSKQTSDRLHWSLPSECPLIPIKQKITPFKQIWVIDTVRVFLQKCPLTTVRSRFSADELQLVRGEAEDTFVVRRY